MLLKNYSKEAKKEEGTVFLDYFQREFYNIFEKMLFTTLREDSVFKI